MDVDPYRMKSLSSLQFRVSRPSFPGTSPTFGPPWRMGVVGRFAIAISLFAGCSKPEPIRHYRVPKPPHRMLAAMLPQGSEAWFFKVSGPRQEVGSQREAFEKFLKSVRLESGSGAKPTWELPAGWKETPGTGERQSTIQIPAGEKPLELTVVRLPVPERSLDDYKLENVNRWRLQIRLGPLTARQLKDESREIQAASGNTITYVDLVGTLSTPRRPMAGMAGMGGMGAGMMPAGEGVGSDPEPLPFEHQTPAGWKPGPTGPLRRLSYRIASEGKSAEVTVINLPAGANDLLSNINRWREQVKLPPVTAAELDKVTQPITMGDVRGSYVELVGAGEESSRETILGVMAVRGDQAWFFKFKGPAALVAQEQGRFESFVKSVRFKS